MTTRQKPTLTHAFIPILFLIVALFYNVFFVFGDDALSGSNQIILLLAAGVAAIVGVKLGYTWFELRSGAVESISSAMSSILILLLIGSLAGTWLLSGVVPAMIYYGLQILSPSIFLAAALIISAIVSVATGSSWSTIATLGVALLGIGKALGMSDGIIAGAIISGAYFGDKMSPLSDTTNLAPAMAGTSLFPHIKYMALTTVPSISIALLIFLIIGFFFNTDASATNVDAVLLAIESKFNLNPLLFLIPAVVIYLIIKKTPAMPALLAGTLLAGLFAIIFQPQIIAELGGDGSFFEQCYVAIMKAMYTDIAVVTDNSMVNDLLSTGGMAGMLSTIWLIVCAMVFGGIMEKAGLLERITESIIKLAHSTGSLVASTVATCGFFNVTASDQYLAIVVPGRMFANTYRERGLAPVNLSRSLEDSGTVTSVLVPWNTCGATQSKVLGVDTLTYLPYCFFNIISPFMSIVFAYLNIKIEKLDDSKESVEA